MVRQDSSVKCLGGKRRDPAVRSCPRGGPPRPEQCRAASVLGTKNLLVGGHHLAIVHIHDLGADLATG